LNDCKVPQASDDGISSLMWNPTAFPDSKGFAIDSFEGRTALVYRMDAIEAIKDSHFFQFKCHRAVDNDQNAYAVNCVSFHNKHDGVFSTVGSDGAFVL
jgi:hypothetical protein